MSQEYLNNHLKTAINYSKGRVPLFIHTHIHIYSISILYDFPPLYALILMAIYFLLVNFPFLFIEGCEPCKALCKYQT